MALYQHLFKNTGALPTHAWRVVSKRASDAVGMRTYLGARSSTFPPISCVYLSFYCCNSIFGACSKSPEHLAPTCDRFQGCSLTSFVSEVCSFLHSCRLKHSRKWSQPAKLTSSPPFAYDYLRSIAEYLWHFCFEMT